MNESAVLYSTGCPNCKALKLMLKKAGIEYAENNSIDEMTELGFKQIPVLCVNGEYLKFNDAKKWIENKRKGECA